CETGAGRCPPPDAAPAPRGSRRGARTLLGWRRLPGVAASGALLAPGRRDLRDRDRRRGLHPVVGGGGGAGRHQRWTRTGTVGLFGRAARIRRGLRVHHARGADQRRTRALYGRGRWFEPVLTGTGEHDGGEPDPRRY